MKNTERLETFSKVFTMLCEKQLYDTYRKLYFYSKTSDLLQTEDVIFQLVIGLSEKSKMFFKPHNVFICFMMSYILYHCESLVIELDKMKTLRAFLKDELALLFQEVLPVEPDPVCSILNPGKRKDLCRSLIDLVNEKNKTNVKFSEKASMEKGCSNLNVEVNTGNPDGNEFWSKSKKNVMYCPTLLSGASALYLYVGRALRYLYFLYDFGIDGILRPYGFVRVEEPTV